MTNNSILSQEEIDALLRGGREEAHPNRLEDVLSIMEIDVLGEVGNMSMGAAATVLSQLVNRKVSITTPTVSLTSVEQLYNSYDIPYLAVDVEYVEGLRGGNLLIIDLKDAATIVELMMGGNGLDVSTEFDEIKLSAISEIMNQMMGSAATSMSALFKRRIDISPPKVKIVHFSSDTFEEIVPFHHQQILNVAFRMQIEDIIDSQIMLLLPVEFAKEMAQFFNGAQSNLSPDTGVNKKELNNSIFDNTGSPTSNNYQKIHEPAITVQPVQFQPLQPTSNYQNTKNIDLIMDVPMQVTVELGRARKLIREILEFGKGSIIELDKLAGEPVDILVNGKLIAKGEVVVIDENFGVRVTDIISPVERVSNLQ